MSVRRSVRLSVTRRYCVETAAYIIKLLPPSASHVILVFLTPKGMGIFRGDPGTPLGGIKCRGMSEKNHYLALSRNLYKTEP